MPLYGAMGRGKCYGARQRRLFPGSFSKGLEIGKVMKPVTYQEFYKEIDTRSNSNSFVNMITIRV